MKTVTELNSKWWYRLIKVIYLLLFIFAMGCSLIAPPVSYLESPKKLIKCGNGVEISPSDLYDKGIYLNSYDSFVSADNHFKIQTLCEPNSKYVSRVKVQKILDDRPNGVAMDDVLNELTKDGWLVEGVNTNPDKAYKEYTADDFKKITYEVKKDIKWGEMIEVLLLSVIGTIIFFEITRRIFYYIVLGSVKPTK